MGDATPFAILVKTVAPSGGLPAAARLSLAGVSGAFSLEPLFASIDAGRLGLADKPAWYRLTVRPDQALAETIPATSAAAWDACHALMRQGFGLDGMGEVAWVEPDLAQPWPVEQQKDPKASLAAAPCTAAPFSDDYPHPDTNTPGWYRDDDHSGLDRALSLAPQPQGVSRLLVAHLDTGLDLKHHALPEHLRLDLARSFVPGEEGSDVSDRSSGLMNNKGHGTATATILAGRMPGGGPLGGAPEAEVVPLRVADSVVLFWTSAIARAMDWVHQLTVSGRAPVSVLTMSMGGLASRAWAEAVNALYDAGVFMVTAAGNNYDNLPTHHLVYPARFHRVVAACGMMYGGKPYADLERKLMAGNYGPNRLMDTALAAFTPNIPWARLGCPDVVDLDGNGTSSATPQIAAAAALWFTRHREAVAAYDKPWMRIEACRKALFASAASGPDVDDRRLGNGILRAAKAMERAPVAKLKKTEEDDVSFPLLRVLLGLGLAAAVPGEPVRMLELEALQLTQTGADFESLLDDPETPPDRISVAQRRRVGEWLLAQPAASERLKAQLRRGLGKVFPPPTTAPGGPTAPGAEAVPPGEPPPELPPEDMARWRQAAVAPTPTVRLLKVYATDPLFGTRLETLPLNEATLEIPWEKDLAPGPVGDYLEVVDVDPPSNLAYAPVDLGHAHLLAADGLTPGEGSPQFHQQMVYAVAMKTIGHFERALGRTALWAPRRTHRPDGKWEERFVRRLRIHPHALRERNAYYSPEKKALLFGYFRAPKDNAGDNLPGGMVFTCLSHDIIAHETTHALLDGLHRRFQEPTNEDVLAFHEAFADIVALFQHFTIPEALLDQVAKTRGDLRQESHLGELAVQFGQATGRYGGLRSAIGTYKDRRWVPHVPSKDDYNKASGPHDRGAVLVAAVFDAFLQIYELRTRDLLRLATGGTGVLPPGAIHPDLARRLAQEAAKTAEHILNICIRALDYCPPIDITFGDYLRALITADRDLVPEDTKTYRVAFISAFRGRGIYPQGVTSLSEGSLVWDGPEIDMQEETMRTMLARMSRKSLGWKLGCDRLQAFKAARINAASLHYLLNDWTAITEPFIRSLGLDRSRIGTTIRIGDQTGKLRPLEIHSVRPARRIGPDGQSREDLVVEITQGFTPDGGLGVTHRGGCTMLIGLAERRIRYVVGKRLDNSRRLENQLNFRLGMAQGTPASTYFNQHWGANDPFALLNRGC